MSLQALFGTFTVLGMVAEISLLIALMVRGQYKTFPVFTLYVAFNLLSDIAVGTSIFLFPAHIVRSLMFGLLPPQYLLELGILLEIAWNVLRPVRASLPRGSLRVFGAVVVLALVGGVLLAWHFDNTGNKIQDVKVPLDLTVGLLRMLIFVATVAFAQLLGIGWKNKVLQLATALSFYSAVSLIVSLVERYSGRTQELDGLVTVAFVFEFAFLVWAFTTKDVQRREFSPQMEQFLVTLAGRAKLARTALVRMQVK
jgi:hypothetical protein